MFAQNAAPRRAAARTFSGGEEGAGDNLRVSLALSIYVQRSRVQGALVRNASRFTSSLFDLVSF